MNLKIAIAFAAAPASDSPNSRANSDAAARLNYTKAMTVAFGSLRRFHPHAELSLVTDQAPENDFERILTSLGVTIRLREFKCRPPETFSDLFVASLYLIDAIDEMSGEESVLFVDPDILCLRNLDCLAADIGSNRLGLLPIPFARDKYVNGLSRLEASEISSVLSGGSRSLSLHYGGEFIYVGADCYQQFLNELHQTYQACLELHAKNRPHFVTEEHMVSHVARSMDVLAMSDAVRRVWTTRLTRDVRRDDLGLCIWHLPAEKGRGFTAIYPSVLDRSSWFWRLPDEDFRRKAAFELAVKRRINRVVTDAAARIVTALRNRIK